MEIDRQTLSSFSNIPSATKDNSPRKNFDGVVVRKPWGFEYLVCESELVALWALKLQFNHQTSMHCHPEKLTVMVALTDGIVLSTLSNSYKLQTGDVVYIEPGVFHRSNATNLQGDWLLEFETPVDKFDLVRLDDAYGRSISAYEGSEFHSSPEDFELIQWLSRYDYVTPKDFASIGDTVISFYRFRQNSDNSEDSITKWASEMNLVVLVADKEAGNSSSKDYNALQIVSPHNLYSKTVNNHYEFALGIRC